MAINVFISYGSPDRPIVEALVQHLEPGLVTWWDRHLVAGQTFSDALFEKIAYADVTLIAWSAIAAKSKWVEKEAEYALKHSIVIPLLLDDTPLPAVLAEIDGIDLRGWDKTTETREVAQLIRDIKLHVGARRKPANHVLLASPAVQTPVGASAKRRVDEDLDHTHGNTSRAAPSKEYRAPLAVLATALIIAMILVAFLTDVIVATILLVVAIGFAYRYIPTSERAKFLMPTLLLLAAFGLMTGLRFVSHVKSSSDISSMTQQTVKRLAIEAIRNEQVRLGRQAPSELISELTKLSADRERLCVAVTHAERAARATLEEVGYAVSMDSNNLSLGLPSILNSKNAAIQTLTLDRDSFPGPEPADLAQKLRRAPAGPLIIGSIIAMERKAESKRNGVGAYADAVSGPPLLIDRLYEAGCLQSEWSTLDTLPTLRLLGVPQPRQLPPLVIELPSEVSWGQALRELLAVNQLDEARSLLQKVSPTDAHAKETLGVLYVLSARDSREEAAGCELIRAAARKGSPQAVANLGFLHIFGLGTYLDPGYGAWLLDRAIEQGLDPSNATWMLRDGSDRMRVSDFVEITKEMQRSAANGSTAARTILGVFAARGLGVPPCGAGCNELAMRYVSDLRSRGNAQLAALVESEILVNDERGREQAMMEMDALLLWPATLRELALHARKAVAQRLAEEMNRQQRERDKRERERTVERSKSRETHPRGK